MYSKQVLCHHCYFVIEQLAFWNYLQTAFSAVNIGVLLCESKRNTKFICLADRYSMFFPSLWTCIEIHVGDADCACPKAVYGSSLAVFHKRFSFQPYYILIHTFRRVLTNSLPTCDQNVWYRAWTHDLSGGRSLLDNWAPKCPNISKCGWHTNLDVLFLLIWFVLYSL